MLQVTLDAPGKFSASNVATPDEQDECALVRVHRIGVCGTDLHAFRGRQPFFSYPRVLGHELGVEVVNPGAAGPRAGERCAGAAAPTAAARSRFSACTVTAACGS
jgi:threonine dehydrogenase-like Zn-dependent dehydrogenase